MWSNCLDTRYSSSPLRAQAFHPDGSRTGSYSYVDPKGETILVKYRADRFGFHVLDGSSIPSTSPHTVNTPNAAPSAPRAQQASSDYVSTLRQPKAAPRPRLPLL